MSELRQAWQALADKIETTGITWATVRGPLAATFLTLARINWRFVGPHHWRSDAGVVYDLLLTAPADMKLFLEESVKRWQVHKLTAHLPVQEPAHDVWERALRLGLRDLQPAPLGALRALWADRLPTPARLCAWGKEVAPLCNACGSTDGSFGHVWFDCEHLLSPDEREAELGFDVLCERHASHRDALRASHLPTEPDWGSLYFCCGFPKLSIQVPSAPEHAEIWEWGDARGEWGPVTF